MRVQCAKAPIRFGVLPNNAEKSLRVGRSLVGEEDTVLGVLCDLLHDPRDVDGRLERPAWMEHKLKPCRVMVEPGAERAVAVLRQIGIAEHSTREDEQVPRGGFCEVATNVLGLADDLIIQPR